MKQTTTEFDDDLDVIMNPQIERLMRQLERFESEAPRRRPGRHSVRRHIEDWQEQRSIRRSIDYLDG